MTHTALYGIVLGLCCILPAVGQEKEAEKKRPAQIEAVLEAVDVKARTITARLGKSIDEVLTEKLRERTKGKPTAKAGGERRTYTLANRHVEIYLKFRSSPSVANNVEHELRDLEKMTTYPLALETVDVDGKPVVTKIIVYRGTPWKLVQPNEPKN